MQAVNSIMSEMTIDAKANHGGWNNITGNAEGSVKTVQFAHLDEGGVSGLWGSEGVNYVIWLELKHGAFLRTAFDNNKGNLAARVKGKWQRLQT